MKKRILILLAILPLFSHGQIKVSNMIEATSLNGDDVFLLVQDNSSKKVRFDTFDYSESETGAQISDSLDILRPEISQEISDSLDILPSVDYGTEGQLPVTNITQDGYNYFTNFVWDGISLKLESGTGNTFVGNGDRSLSTGTDNTCMGESSGNSNTAGEGNVFIGKSSGFSNTLGIDNVFSGAFSGFSNLQGFNNVFIGKSSGFSNTTGIDNTFMGEASGNSNTSGDNNVFIGSRSGFSNITGVDNTFLGRESGLFSTGNNNVFLGRESGKNNTGDDNVFLGYKSGANETGSNKLYIENSNSATPLIYGEFDNDLVRINGKLVQATTRDIQSGVESITRHTIDTIKPIEDLISSTFVYTDKKTSVVDTSNQVDQSELVFFPYNYTSRNPGDCGEYFGMSYNSTLNGNCSGFYQGFQNNAKIDVWDGDSVTVENYLGFYNNPRVVLRNGAKLYIPFDAIGLYNKQDIAVGAAGGIYYTPNYYGIKSEINIDPDITYEITDTSFGCAIIGTIPGAHTNVGFYEQSGDNLFYNKIETLDTIVAPVLVLNGNSVNHITTGDTLGTKSYIDAVSGEFRQDSNGNLIAGTNSGSALTTGLGNIFIGENTGESVSTNSYNVFLGYNTGVGSNVSNAVAVGANAQSTNNSTSVGCESGKNNTAANQTYYGYQSGFSNTTGNQNTFMGYKSGFANTIENYNTFIGFESGRTGTGSTYTVAVGYASGKGNSGDNSTLIGARSGFVNEGENSTFIGYESGLANTTGIDNTFMGEASGNSNTSGDNNVFIGSRSGFSNITGVDNTFLGRESGLFSTGNNNVFLGRESGKNNTGDDNVFLGYKSDITGNVSDRLVIANSETTTPLILGKFDTEMLEINGDLKIIRNGDTLSISNANGKWTISSGDTIQIGDSTIKIFPNGDVEIEGELTVGSVITPKASSYITTTAITTTILADTYYSVEGTVVTTSLVDFVVVGDAIRYVGLESIEVDIVYFCSFTTNTNSTLVTAGVSVNDVINEQSEMPRLIVSSNTEIGSWGGVATFTLNPDDLVKVVVASDKAGTELTAVTFSIKME